MGKILFAWFWLQKIILIVTVTLIKKNKQKTFEKGPRFFCYGKTREILCSYVQKEFQIYKVHESNQFIQTFVEQKQLDSDDSCFNAPQKMFDDNQIQIMRMKNTKLKESRNIKHALAVTKSTVLEHSCSTNNFTILLSPLHIKLLLSCPSILFWKKFKHFWIVVR